MEGDENKFLEKQDIKKARQDITKFKKRQKLLNFFRENLKIYMPLLEY